jgi:hypothetical protein
MWFLASWVPKAWKYGAGSHLIFAPSVGMGSGLGRATGVLALVVAIGFLAVAWGIYIAASWWTPLALVAACVSLVAIVVPWARTIPPMNILGAFTVDVLLIAAVLVPSFGDRLTGAV